MLMRLFSVLLLSLLFVAGCTRPTEQQGEVSGKVTYKGKPLPGGKVNFVAANGYNGIGIISPQGEYSVKSPLGAVQIGVDNRMLKFDPESKNFEKKGRLKRPEGMSGGGENPQNESAGTPRPRTGVPGTYVKIPARYTDPTTSGLKFTVEPGSQTHDIELTDDASAKPGP